MINNNNKSPHILGPAASLFGLCYVVFTSLHALNLANHTLIDEFTSVSMVLFLVSCICSFLAIRSANKKALLFDKIADYGFLIGLITLFITTIFLTFKIVK